MQDCVDRSPLALAEALAQAGVRRGCIVLDPETGALHVSHPLLESVAHALRGRPLGFADHEAILLAVGPGGALFGAFVHSTVRGQAQGGVRRWDYPALEDFLADGLRLSRGMSRKSALAGLWWGGGKGVIAAPPGVAARPEERRELYEAYGRFVAGLRGCFIAAEDVGTSPADVAAMFSRSRFVSCIPPAMGGSGNPSPATAEGVRVAIESALAFLGRGELAGKRVAVQGAGQVGRALVASLLRRGARVVVADPNREAIERLRGEHAGAALEARCDPPDDPSLLFEPCDVLAPCALGAVLDDKTIPGLRTRLVCGSANNQLADDARDGGALAARGITWVPDFLANRMGIVNCSDEPFGSLPDDPNVLRHLDPDWPDSIPAATARVLARARDEEIPPGEAANRLADEALALEHPVHGHRGRRILAGLVADRWASGTDDPPAPG